MLSFFLILLTEHLLLASPAKFYVYYSMLQVRGTPGTVVEFGASLATTPLLRALASSPQLQRRGEHTRGQRRRRLLVTVELAGAPGLGDIMAALPPNDNHAYVLIGDISNRGGGASDSERWLAYFHDSAPLCGRKDGEHNDDDDSDDAGAYSRDAGRCGFDPAANWRGLFYPLGGRSRASDDSASGFSGRRGNASRLDASGGSSRVSVVVAHQASFVGRRAVLGRLAHRSDFLLAHDVAPPVSLGGCNGGGNIDGKTGGSGGGGSFWDAFRSVSVFESVRCSDGPLTVVLSNSGRCNPPPPDIAFTEF